MLADEFALYNNEDTKLQTVKNDAAGAFAFAPIEYTTADDGKPFVYTVKEVMGPLARVAYDDTEFTVEVEVADSPTGLTATATVTNPSSASKIVFTNIYTRPSTPTGGDDDTKTDPDPETDPETGPVTEPEPIPESPYTPGGTDPYVPPAPTTPGNTLIADGDEWIELDTDQSSWCREKDLFWSGA